MSMINLSAHGPVPASEQLVRRIEEGVALQQEVAMRQVATLPGNPDGAAVMKVPGATAFRTTSAPASNQMNHICVFGPEWTNSLETLVRFYDEHQITPRLRIPEMLLPGLEKAVGDLFALEMVEDEIRFCGVPLPVQPVHSDGVQIVEVFDIPEMDLWLELFSEAFLGMARKRDDTPVNGPAWANWRAFHMGPGRRHFLAYTKGIPVAVAGMFSSNGVTYLGPAATLPQYRDRGLHTALLLQRMYLAGLDGCELITCGAVPGSVSSRNQERQGLLPLYRRPLIRLQRQ